VADRQPVITVLAGTNGAGKSSILGEFIRRHGGEYYNPDETARALRVGDPKLPMVEANGLAWSLGVEGLESAVVSGTDFVFESTLGGETIPALLAGAALRGSRVVVWYVGLDDVEEHVRRVQARARLGGHDIPEPAIRARYVRSIENLVLLVPSLNELKLFDNSKSVNMAAGEAPALRALFHMRAGRIVKMVEGRTMPDWAKPVVAAALQST
jgi:predicted ABC-type ATPase